MITERWSYFKATQLEVDSSFGLGVPGFPNAASNVDIFSFLVGSCLYNSITMVQKATRFSRCAVAALVPL